MIVTEFNNLDVMCSVLSLYVNLLYHDVVFDLSIVSLLLITYI